MKISEKELKIFSRHLILPEFNGKNFELLQKQKITIVGLGGIGSPISIYLASTGIKHFNLIDSDKVEITNLNRQILFTTKDIGKKKSQVAKKRLLGINPKCNIIESSSYLNEKNIKKSLEKTSLVVDATDNWKSMILINKYCVENSIPLVSVSVVGFSGQVAIFENSLNQHLCLQCIFPNEKEPELARCQTVGILGTVAGLVGLITAQKIINFFIGTKDTKYLTLIDAKTLNMHNVRIKKNKNCKCLKKKLNY